MLSAVLSVVGVLVVGGLLFLAGSLLLGRGESQPPAETDRSPVELPDDRPVVGDDVRGLQISPALRGYRMVEVDWLLDQFARALDERDHEIAALRARLAAATGTPTDPSLEVAGRDAGGSPAGRPPADGPPTDGPPTDGPPTGEALTGDAPPAPSENGAGAWRG